MRGALDTSVLLAKGESVLFLVHRASDGWIALDVAGKELAVLLPGARWMGPSIRLRRGGPEYPDRTFSLYALETDPLELGGLRVPAPGGLRFGFGGDLEAIVRAARGEGSSRLVLFRGLTVIARRSRSVPEAWTIARADPERVFASAPPTSRSDRGTRRAGAPDSARARRG